MPSRRPINAGERFTKLLVIGPATPIVRARPQTAYRVTCRCDCGSPPVIVWETSLRTGGTRSCGCLLKSRPHGGPQPKHPLYKTPTYKIWRGLFRRCDLPNGKSFHRYGGRGITICARWRESFDHFLADMGERPAGKEIDRYPDNDGNYEPGNCRWATKQEQASNRRNTQHIILQGEPMTAAEAARKLRISGSALYVYAKRNNCTQQDAADHFAAKASAL